MYACEVVVTVEDHFYKGGIRLFFLEHDANQDDLLHKVMIRVLKSEVSVMVGSQSELEK